MLKLESPPLYYIVYSKGYKSFNRLAADTFDDTSARYFILNYEGAVAVYPKYALNAELNDNDESVWVVMEEKQW